MVSTRSRKPPLQSADRSMAEGPSLERCMAVAAIARCEFDQGKRNAGLAAVSRTMSGISGSVGGFGLKPEMATEVWDKARSVDGPLARCTFRTTLQREFWLPGFAETSRAGGSRWGGVKATWGLGETTLPPTSQPSTNRVNFNLKRLLIYTEPISRDLLADTELVAPLLSYASHSEIRYQIEYAMINSTLSGPAGVIAQGGGPGRGVVQCAKTGGQSSGTINATNIDTMWASLYGPCKRTAIWCANDDTISAIDETAQTGGWAESIYLPQGVRGNEFALIKGRPLIPCESCQVIGTPGDLIVADWSQYWFVVKRPAPGAGTLAFDTVIPQNIGHQGVVALPEGVVEQTMADETFFDIDSVAFAWKLRGDGQPLWGSTMTNINGATVGWACIIAAR